MSEYHEIKVIEVTKNELIDTIYIHDDFFGYLWEKEPHQHKLLNNIPVFYPNETDLVHLDKFQDRGKSNKGIDLTGINVLNSTSFEELVSISIKWGYTIRNWDVYSISKLDYEFSKDEVLSNIEKLSIIFRKLSLDKNKYILLWEGI